MVDQLDALVVIEADRTLVAHLGGRSPEVASVSPFGFQPSGYLRQIVHEVGDAYRVTIVGPADVRLALEREYVAIHRQPDRLRDLDLR